MNKFFLFHTVRRLCWTGLLLAALGMWVGIGCEPEPSGEEPLVTEPSKEPTVEPAQNLEPIFDANPGVDRSEPRSEPPAPEKKPDAVDNKPYKIVLFDRETIHSNGTINVRNIVKAFKLRHKTFSSAVFKLELASPCYPLDNPNWSKIPQGHRWPPACDAFDRNMNITWNPPKAGGPPGFDLIRAITPFGGPMSITVNVTDLANGLSSTMPPGTEHSMKVHISTYSDGKGQVSGSKGSWIVSATLELTPGPAPRNVLAVIPLFDHSYRHNDGKMEKAEFTIPKDTVSTVLFYSATGHGGGKADSSCIGPADEFCRRTHRLFADGKKIVQFIPWRSDCAKYCTEVSHPRSSSTKVCKENPCGSKASVRASRANWCPGSSTAPMIQRIAEYNTPGKHTFGYSVANVAKGGSWRVSSHIIVYGK